MKRLLTLVLLTLTFGSAVAADKTVYYHTDALGSVVAATDEQGELLWRESYKPFGDRLDRQVSTKDNSAFFTGKPHDDTTGLSYFGARYYDPEIGRFTGIDPAGVDPGNIYSFSGYAYANNNPYGFVDPDGMLGLSIHSFQRGLSREDAMAVSGMGNAALISTAASMAVVIDEGSDYVNPIKGILKKGVKKIVTKGLKGNKDFKAALGQFKNTKFTNAGRAVTKHPEYFGFKNTEALRKVYNTEAKINKLAADTLKGIMRNGKTTTGAGGRYPNGWKTITAPDGRAASWHADGRFIGFRGVQ